MENTDKLKLMMKQAEDVFKQIDKIGDELRKEKMTKDEEFYSTRLDVLTGCYTYITPRYYRLKAEHTNEKMTKYMSLKVEAEKNEEKFVNASAEKEADASVKTRRVVRNIFEGYMKAAENSINTCKLQIKRIKGELGVERNTN